MTKSNAGKSYAPAIAVCFALFFMIAFVTNLAGSMGVVVTNQFGASKALSQLGTLANFIAYACMGIPAGIILRRKGYKFTALAAVVIGFIGVGIQFLSGYAESFAVYVAGTFVAGFSMCMLNIVVNPMLNTLMQLYRRNHCTFPGGLARGRLHQGRYRGQGRSRDDHRHGHICNRFRGDYAHQDP